MNSSVITVTTRRELLVALACTAGAAALSQLQPLRGPLAELPVQPSAWQYLIFQPLSSADFGQHYRSFFPDEDTLGILRRLLGASVIGFAADASPSTLDHLRSALESQARLDFAQGNTVMIEGWILSRTEARLCALYR